LGHLGARGYSPATVRAYAFDVANFATFLEERKLALGEVVPSDLFAYLDWQQLSSRGNAVRAARSSRWRARGRRPRR
jgi:integrase/recombinase XerC